MSARLAHCTGTFSGHSPSCDRDGTYCSLVPSHSGVVWKLAPYASAAWEDATGRWLVYMRDALWIARDRSLPSDPRQHGRDQERAFYTGADMLRYIKACS